MQEQELTLSRFYWAVNVGALSPLITVNVEAHVSFWAAYLIPLVYVHWISFVGV
jgi:POT family proton-dependent oligopeptide transporter